MNSRSRRPRERSPSFEEVREKRRESSQYDNERRRRRRRSPASSEEDIPRRKVHNDPSDQESDPDYPPPPPPEPENDANIRYRPMAPFSWRNEICRFLDVSPDALDDEVFQAMTKASIILKEAEQMKAKYEAGRGPPRYEIIHSVRCEQSRTEGRLYLDQPWVVETGPNDAHLRGSQPILNFELFLERNKEIVFVIYKDYRCCGRQHNSRSRAHTEPDGQVDASSLLTAEHISIISPDLSSAMEEFSDIALGDFPHTDFRGGEEMRHPYIWWFHRRKEIDEALEKYKSSPWLPMVYLFREYILGRMTEEWETVDGLLARKRICLKYMDYLFATKVNVTFWTFNGTFRKASKECSIKDITPTPVDEMDEFNITDLPLYPIEYASSEIADALHRFSVHGRYRNTQEVASRCYHALPATGFSREKATVFLFFSMGGFILIVRLDVTDSSVVVPVQEKRSLLKGTKAEDVERYLNVVLHLGKTWGCGILILTSNRVGIFDEAFKSRIQLNLRYKTLDRAQRKQIWKNFFIRLRRLEQENGTTGGSYGANVDEMMGKLDDLAEANLNGRQIRNAVSTARQLARYQKEPLSYKHLTAVIDEAKKFDEYLLELNRSYTADEIQRDKGER
ncbi:hypothetical protein FGSG_09116 [Fusarium graminearum PH-1]|uniref:hypothetical protein n=1 Tax=Gibberella zeae (strain ATCC MYA-4620 / CBS 123657 / FGSC 9075 / NRRL 31084 / PH-1) TaxID=229533 RepID=UPI00021F15B9|nr:hypothetical protein FGSG_09116 [Fusarium graminearum PH-1]ESU15644.1 hypothetical protein FGSG_09116 [Fusarium graminearum PH-1]|eukprot:XP_011328672.1 hypothetical protein FGSG_09116 [Fusarium graminearum PH-1]